MDVKISYPRTDGDLRFERDFENLFEYISDLLSSDAHSIQDLNSILLLLKKIGWSNLPSELKELLRILLGKIDGNLQDKVNDLKGLTDGEYVAYEIFVEKFTIIKNGAFDIDRANSISSAKKYDIPSVKSESSEGVKSEKVNKPVVKVNAGSNLPGQKATWNPELENPKPNTVYEVTVEHDNQSVVYEYETDHVGNTVRVKGKLVRSPIASKNRNKWYRRLYTQIKYGGSDKRFDGGHFFATIFQGPAEKINIIPQENKTNRTGEWRKFERFLDKMIKAGKDAEVEIKVCYDKASEYDGSVDLERKPLSLMATYKIKGYRSTLFFKNRAE
jgi:hypothetical protein